MRVTPRSERRDRGEGGFTVIEIAVAMGLSMLAATSIFGMLMSQTRIEKRATDFTINQEDARRARELSFTAGEG